MKKYIALVLLCALLTAAVCGCSQKQAEESSSTSLTEATSTAVETAQTTEQTSPVQTTATTVETVTEQTTTEPETPPEEPKEKGLVAFWDFDEIENGVVADKSGNGHDAKVHGSPTIEDLTDGKAIKLAKIGDHLLVDDSDDLDFGRDDDFSVTARIKWNGTYPDNWACILNRGLMTSAGAYNYFGFWIDSSTNKPQCGVSNIAANGCLNLSAKEPLDTNWHTLKIVQRGDISTLYFFIDETLQATSNSISSTSAQPLFIGYNGNSGNQGQFAGLIDSIKIYNIALQTGDNMEGSKTVDAMLRGVLDYKNEENGKGIVLPYRVYFPTDYDENDSKTYPMLFFLHGHGECGEDNNQQIRVLGGPNKLLDDVVAADNCIVVAPQTPCNLFDEWVPLRHNWNKGSRDALGEQTTSMSAAMALLDKFLEGGKVDKDRVYAAGISMGGYGTWELITRRPEVFAAAIPLCGAGIPSMAKDIKGIAIWAFHGEADGTVPVSGTRDMETALKAVGGNIKATYFPGVGHSCWTNAYATDGLVDWLFEQHK